MEFQGIVGPTYRSRSVVADSEVCMNWAPAVIQSPNARFKAMLEPTPGTVNFASSIYSPNRGAFAEDGRAFVVIGAVPYEVTAAGLMLPLGVVDVDKYPATICSSGTIGGQLLITSGGSAYIYSLTAGGPLTKIAGLVANQGAFLDGFFIALNFKDSAIRISAYADGLTWDPTQFRVRATASDKWTAMAIINHKEIWLMGTKTYEIWYNAGLSPFPFLPIPNAFYSQGIVAPFSLVAVGESVAWVSQNKDDEGMVVLAEQYAPTPISHYALDYELQLILRAGGTLSDAVSLTYAWGGHQFMSVNFPSANITRVFDLSTRSWHERGHLNSTSGLFDAWRPMFHMYAFDKHLVGDYTNGKIYQMAEDIYSDADAYIRRVRRAPGPFYENQWVYTDNLEIHADVGLGLVSGQGSDPRIMVRWSKDGGRTWGNERWRSAGAIGEYNTRIQIQRIPRARKPAIELSVSDPIQWTILGVTADVVVSPV